MKTAAFLCLVSAAAANITFSRSLSQVLSGASGTLTIGPDGTCTGSDQYGSNDCTLNWGTNYTAAYDVTLPEAIDADCKINVALKVDGLLPLSFSCAACGAACTFKIPVIGKTVTIPAIDCPLVKAGELKGQQVLPVPSKDPVPLSTSVKGTVTLVDGSGKTLAAVAVDAKLA